jgi:hypothetical protein
VFDQLETFSREHQYTISALGVVGTFCAVIVSLTVALIAQRSNRTQIMAYVSKSVIHHSTLEGKVKPTYVTVHIKNKGLLPVAIPFSFFHWRVPFRRDGWIVNPWDYSQGDDWIPQRRYPFEIKARAAETFFLADIETFRSETQKLFAGNTFVERCGLHFLRARVITDDGLIFDAKLDRSIQKEISAIRSAASKAAAL